MDFPTRIGAGAGIQVLANPQRFRSVSDIEFQPSENALTFLFSAQGNALLTQLAADQTSDRGLPGYTARLRKSYPPDVVAAALDVSLLRQRARVKFSRADRMFFTRQALEQASAEVVSRYRAKRFAGRACVADLCCGIGGDALGLAQYADVLAIDLDPVRLRMAAANASVYGVGDRLSVECADVAAHAFPGGACFWADPSRRVQGKRVFSLARYQPPLQVFLDLAKTTPGAGIKLSPGVDYAELARLLGSAQHEVEIVSVCGAAREAVLWLGALCTARRRATLLPGDHSLVERPLGGPIAVTPVGRYLYEPDAAVIRAHLVEHLAEEVSATKIDEQIAYLTADARIESPFVTGYFVEEVMPFSLKRINRRLRARDVGELVIKKRGLGIDPEQFRRRLKVGKGQRKTVLVLTRVRDCPTALICSPMAGR
jgi:SAM-dependent methyltransferase